MNRTELIEKLKEMQKNRSIIADKLARQSVAWGNLGETNLSDADLRSTIIALEAAEADKRRLDWIEDQKIFSAEFCCIPEIWEIGTIQSDEYPRPIAEVKGSLRSALDASMSQTQQKESI